MSTRKPDSIDFYIASQPVGIRPTLRKLRATIQKAVPDAEEVISYQMPAFKYHGIVLWFASFKKHYSVFVRPVFLDAFKLELAKFRKSKSAISFPHGKEAPVRLITKIAKYVAAQNARAGGSVRKKLRS